MSMKKYFIASEKDICIYFPGSLNYVWAIIPWEYYQRGNIQLRAAAEVHELK